QGVDLWRGEPGEQCALVALGRDGQDPLGDGGAFGVVQCGVAEQRVDGGRRQLRGRTGVRRSASRWARKAATSGASRSAMSSAEGVLPVWAEAKPTSSRSVSR